MLDLVSLAGLQDIEEALYVGVDIGVRVFDGVAYSCLGCQVDHVVELVFFKQCFYVLAVDQVELDKADALCACHFFVVHHLGGVDALFPQAGEFELYAVVGVEVV